jgi:hypothetical protein
MEGDGSSSIQDRKRSMEEYLRYIEEFRTKFGADMYQLHKKIDTVESKNREGHARRVTGVRSTSKDAGRNANGRGRTPEQQSGRSGGNSGLSVAKTKAAAGGKGLKSPTSKSPERAGIEADAKGEMAASLQAVEEGTSLQIAQELEQISAMVMLAAMEVKNSTLPAPDEGEASTLTLTGHDDSRAIAAGGDSASAAAGSTSSGEATPMEADELRQALVEPQVELATSLSSLVRGCKVALDARLAARHGVGVEYKDPEVAGKEAEAARAKALQMSEVAAEAERFANVASEAYAEQAPPPPACAAAVEADVIVEGALRAAHADVDEMFLQGVSAIRAAALIPGSELNFDATAIIAAHQKCAQDTHAALDAADKSRRECLEARRAIRSERLSAKATATSGATGGGEDSPGMLTTLMEHDDEEEGEGDEVDEEARDVAADLSAIAAAVTTAAVAAMEPAKQLLGERAMEKLLESHQRISQGLHAREINADDALRKRLAERAERQARAKVSESAAAARLEAALEVVSAGGDSNEPGTAAGLAFEEALYTAAKELTAMQLAEDSYAAKTPRLCQPSDIEEARKDVQQRQEALSEQIVKASERQSVGMKDRLAARRVARERRDETRAAEAAVAAEHRKQMGIFERLKRAMRSRMLAVMLVQQAGLAATTTEDVGSEMLRKEAMTKKLSSSDSDHVRDDTERHILQGVRTSPGLMQKVVELIKSYEESGASPVRTSVKREAIRGSDKEAMTEYVRNMEKLEERLGAAAATKGNLLNRRLKDRGARNNKVVPVPSVLMPIVPNVLEEVHGGEPPTSQQAPDSPRGGLFNFGGLKIGGWFKGAKPGLPPMSPDHHVVLDIEHAT